MNLSFQRDANWCVEFRGTQRSAGAADPYERAGGDLYITFNPV